MGRRGGHSDYAVAGAAAWVRKDERQHLRRPHRPDRGRHVPTLAAAATEAIRQRRCRRRRIAAAADKAVDGVTVLEDLYGSEDYKRHLANVYVGRALTQAMSRDLRPPGSLCRRLPPRKPGGNGLALGPDR